MISFASIYSAAFLIGSLLIATTGLLRRAVPQGIRWVRLLLPLVLVLAAGGLLGWLLAQSGGVRELALGVLAVLMQWQAMLPGSVASVFDVPLAWLQSVTNADELPLMLTLVLLFVWGYLLVRLILLIVLWFLKLLAILWRWGARLIVRLRKGAWPQQLPGYPQTLPPSAGFLVPSARSALIVLAVLLAALPWADRLPPLAEYLVTLFWAGSWIALVEIAVWLRNEECVEREQRVTGNDQHPTRIDLIEDLYREYQQRHAGQILLARKEPAHGTTRGRENPFGSADDATEKAVKRRFQAVYPQAVIDSLLRVWRHLSQGHDVLLPETLSAPHFGLFAELVEHHVR